MDVLCFPYKNMFLKEGMIFEFIISQRKYKSVIFDLLHSQWNDSTYTAFVCEKYNIEFLGIL